MYVRKFRGWHSVVWIKFLLLNLGTTGWYRAGSEKGVFHTSIISYKQYMHFLHEHMILVQREWVYVHAILAIKWLLLLLKQWEWLDQHILIDGLSCVVS